jgi:hypothetical protein
MAQSKAAQNNPAIDESFISTDTGNGYAGVYQLVNGRVKSHGLPHARARVTGAKLMTDLGGQNVADYADFLGQRYGYGEGIYNLTDAPIDMHQNTARRYGGNMHIFLTLVNIAELGVKSGSELTLIVPAPPGLLNEVAPQIKAAFLAGEAGDNSGRWSIQLRTDKKPRCYIIKRVIVIAEGVGAYAAYRFDQDGDTAELPDGNGGDALAGRIAVLDLGAGTGDTLTIYDGNFNPDAIRFATDDKAGVIHNLLKPILSDVIASVPQATHLTTAHIDSVLRRYIAAGDDRAAATAAATLRVSGRNLNIEPSILGYCERYAEWIAANKVDPLFASGIDALVMTGGGWLYCGRSIVAAYPGRLILYPELFRHMQRTAYYDLNGVGGLHFAAAVFKAQQG